MLRWLPEQVSTFGGDIDALIALIYYVVGAWFIVLHLLLLYMLVAFRRREGRPAQYLTGKGKKQLAWILLPTVLVLGLDFWIDHRGEAVWAAVKENRPEADLHLRVVGEQFNWKVLYAGPDGEFDTGDDVTMENSMHVPEDSVVAIDLQSEDVLHSFFLPHLRLKQDAVPGRTIPIWFEAVDPGKYPIACAELCGFGHTNMGGFLTVHDPASWDAWLEKKWPAGGSR